MPFLYMDPTFLVFAIPGLILALWAQFKVKGTFARFAKVPTSRQVSGIDAAKMIMRDNGLGHVDVRGTHGQLTDHYDPRSKAIFLSDSSAQNSVASVAVVAHELGHAEQDTQNYGPLKLRGAIVPAVQVGGWVGPALFMLGLILGVTQLAWLGLIAFTLTAVFPWSRCRWSSTPASAHCACSKTATSWPATSCPAPRKSWTPRHSPTWRQRCSRC